MKSGPATNATPSFLAAASRAPPEKKAGPRHERDALVLGRGQQGRRVDVVVEVEPQEVAAARDDELRLTDQVAQRLDERVAPLGQGGVDDLDVLRQRPGA